MSTDGKRGNLHLRVNHMHEVDNAALDQLHVLLQIGSLELFFVFTREDVAEQLLLVLKWCSRGTLVYKGLHHRLRCVVS